MPERGTVWRLHGAGPRAGVARVRRRLERLGTVTARAIPARTLEFLDTFDGRLRRAGLALAREGGGRIVLRDAHSGCVLCACAWRGARAPRVAEDLPPGELRARVAPLAVPRALLASFAAQRRGVDFEVGWPDGGGEVCVRWERATIHRSGTPAAVEVVVIGPVGTRRLRALSGALAHPALRAAPGGWYAELRRAAGVRAPLSPRPALALPPDATLRAVAAAAFLHWLRVIEQNEAGVRADLDAEFVHDFRVALRRTRSGLAQLGGVFPAALARDFRARFAQVTDASGPLRDLDVQLARRSGYEALVPPELRAGLAGVFAELARDRGREHARLVAVIDGAPYRRLKREWRASLRALASGAPLGVDADEPAVRLLARGVRHRHARVLALAGAESAAGDEALHRVRIACKKLRYAIEFLAPLVTDADGALARLERVQDALGEYNDVRVQVANLNAALAGTPAGQPGAAERAAAIGAVLAGLERRRSGLRRRCRRRIDELGGHEFTHALARITGARGATRRRKEGR